MARKDVFGSVLATATPRSDARDVTGYAVRGASRSIMQSFEELSKGSIVDLDPGLVDGSFVADRLDASDQEYQELLAAVRDHGQDTPILVRPHPTNAGRYQTVFGHRRVKVAQQLGRPVRAVIKELGDRDHIIAQGQENTARANLSFIEKTLFAARILAQGHDADTVKAALATDDTTLSKMRSVSANVPDAVIHAIGPAKGTGRDRWWQLSKLLEMPADREKATEFVGTARFAAVDSDARFDLLFGHLSQPIKSATGKSRVKTKTWSPRDRTVTAKITDTGRAFTLVLKSKEASRFGTFISENLEQLFRAFKDQETRSETGD